MSNQDSEPEIDDSIFMEYQEVDHLMVIQQMIPPFLTKYERARVIQKKQQIRYKQHNRNQMRIKYLLQSEDIYQMESLSIKTFRLRYLI